MSKTTPETTPAGSTATNAEQQASTGPFKPTIEFEDFARVDLRVARVLEAQAHPNADKLLVLKVDDGSGTPRQICAGLRAYYQPQDLVGKSVIVVANLTPRQLRGQESRGMLLAASAPAQDDQERSVVLVAPIGDVPPGSIVS
ncbi:MAG: hypothetical protein KatS3mg103_0763 [Phycisphaerales bacterium]|nr:MAG: hypothetical protein KatS3mg103_0763 [Phycisphaerales bacterium]